MVLNATSGNALQPGTDQPLAIGVHRGHNQGMGQTACAAVGRFCYHVMNAVWLKGYHDVHFIPDKPGTRYEVHI